MSDEALKKLDAIEANLKETKEELREIKNYIGARDRMSNVEYCKDAGISLPALKKWFDKGCPRLDNRRVSKSAVDKWASENNTRQPKNKK